MGASRGSALVRRALLGASLLALTVSSCVAPPGAPGPADLAADPVVLTAAAGAAGEKSPAGPSGASPETALTDAPEGLAAPPQPEPREPVPPAPAPADPAPPAAPAPVEAAPQPVAPAPGPAEPTRVVVPRIGVHNLLVPVGLNPDHTLQVPDQAPTAGWYTGAPRPGETGPSIITGHNFWNGAPGVFSRLHELVPGDVVEVHHADGSIVGFRVERIEQHPKAAFPSERVYGTTSRQEVRVITCGGVFDPDAGAHVDNIIVFGVRTS